jgi:serine/threonine protein kinase
VNQHIVGAYELGALLAKGTVGEVYRARHCETGAPAVVKFLQAATAGDLEIQRRFVREVAIAEQLSHPNIVRHYDCGLHEDRIYFAMELVECGTLKDVLLKRNNLPWREAVECAIQVCAALAHAHSLGVIHRDLKPANLFLSADGRVKVGDFGLARDLNRSRLTLEGQTVGTCRYMPPEQITGDAELSGATDLYALGCILYQSLTGRPPFDGNTIIEIFEHHLYSEPVPLGELVRDCPAALCDLVSSLLAKDPIARPGSAAHVAAELESILIGRRRKRVAGTKAEKSGGASAVFGESASPNLTARLHADSPVSRRGPKLGLFVALGIIIAALAMAFAFWR